MGNTLLGGSSHTEILLQLNESFAAQYEANKKLWVDVNSNETATVTFQSTQHTLVLLNAFLFIITLNPPTITEVIELEDDADNVFGPVQRTGNPNELKITSALQTPYILQFSKKKAMQHWQSILNDTIHTIKAANASEHRTRTTSTAKITNNPLENVSNSVVDVSNQDVQWNVNEEGIVHGTADGGNGGEGGDSSAASTASASPDSGGETTHRQAATTHANIQTSMADVQHALANHMLPLHQDHATGGIWHQGPLMELRGRALSSASKRPKWAEIVDDVFIYYDWDKDQTPLHHEKCKGSPKFIDLERIESAHVGILETQDSVFGACCGTRMGLDTEKKITEKRPTETTESSATAMPAKQKTASASGFSVFWQKKGKRVAASFLTNTMPEAEKWVTMINECTPELFLLLLFLVVCSCCLFLFADILYPTQGMPCNPKEVGSDVETFASFMENCNNGDILLFRGKKINNKLLRGITRSKFDHVGLVIRGPAGPYL